MYKIANSQSSGYDSYLEISVQKISGKKGFNSYFFVNRVLPYLYHIAG